MTKRMFNLEFFTNIQTKVLNFRNYLTDIVAIVLWFSRKTTGLFQFENKEKVQDLWNFDIEKDTIRKIVKSFSIKIVSEFFLVTRQRSHSSFLEEEEERSIQIFRALNLLQKHWFSFFYTLQTFTVKRQWKCIEKPAFWVKVQFFNCNFFTSTSLYWLWITTAFITGISMFLLLLPNQGINYH